MLVLNRRKGERIMMGKDVVITVVDIRGPVVRLGIEAPKELRIDREEVRVQRSKSDKPV